jgi:hypothetical protein
MSHYHIGRRHSGCLGHTQRVADVTLQEMQALFEFFDSCGGGAGVCIAERVA